MKPYASKRGGLSRVAQRELDRLARWVVMLHAGAALVTDEGREQWWGPCQYCHKDNWLSWCHVFTRGAWAARWMPSNAFAGCAGCHRWLDQHWEAKRDWVISRIGEEQFDYMKFRASQKIRDLDIPGTLAHLKQEIRNRGAWSAYAAS